VTARANTDAAAHARNFRHHFSATAQRRLNLFRRGSTYPLPGALQSSGTTPAPPSEYIPLGRRSAFCATRTRGRASAAGRARDETGIDISRGPSRATGPGDYFSEVLTDVNIVLSVVPSPFTTAMMARLIPAAIKAYSIAVAADSSAKNRTNKLFIPHLLAEQHRISAGSPKWNLSLK
jgi:hypothetical protein